MSNSHGTFFTSVGCMDGRVQKAIAQFGHEKFDAEFPDTITEAGLDGLLAKTADQNLLESLKKKILISVEKHHSKAVVVHGHEDCAGNPVGEKQHKQDIAKVVERLKSMIGNNIKVVGVYLKVNPTPQVIPI